MDGSVEKEWIHCVRNTPHTHTHKLTTWKYLKWQTILKRLFTSLRGELQWEIAAIATKFLKEGLLLLLKVRLCWAFGPRERRRSSRWEGRTEWDWREKKQLRMTQKPETKSEKSVFYRKFQSIGCVSCFSNIISEPAKGFGNVWSEVFRQLLPVWREANERWPKKVLWGGFVIPRCHFVSSKFTNTSDKQRGLI